MELFKLNRYHNSLPIRDERKLRHRERKATGQTQIILDFMKAHCMESFTPAQLHNELKRPWPLTSIRARLTDLTKEGLLFITGELREGNYGEANNCWQYAGKPSLTSRKPI